MTEAQARQHILGIVQGWVGRKEKDGSHKAIIDIYNGHKPLARSYAVKYTDSWCATCISAAAIQAGYADIIPLECGCGQMVELAKRMGTWEESDAYRPEPGDIIMYDWQDSGAGDNAGWPDHVGMVERVSGNTITVIEGNMNDAVGRRNIQVNGRYIRGYITPNYASKANEKDPAPAKPETPSPAAGSTLAVGTIVNFTGNTHYISSNAVSGKGCKPGKAKITQTYNGKHPYHLEAVPGGGATVHGWVDAVDIQGAAGSSGHTGNGEIKVGDVVKYSGTVQYTSSYASGKRRVCKGGKAKVTQISKGKPHPYHLESMEKGCTVHGWVDADKVSR